MDTNRGGLAALLYGRVERWRATHGTPPSRWLMAPRVAREVIAELRVHLIDEEDGSMIPETREIPPEQLTQLFGVPVELVHDLPQGAVLR